MFQNMSKREKTLAMLVGCTVPLWLIFIGWVTFNNRYELGKSQIAGLEKQISEEKRRQLAGNESRVRKKYSYLPSSFPSGGQQNVSRYQNWLVELQRECGFSRSGLTKPESDVVKFKAEKRGTESSVVGKKYTFKFDTTATLDQVLQFCFKFESLDVLHKIKQLNFTPLKRRSGEKTELTGKCKADFVIEVLALTDADETTDFSTRKKQLDKSIEDYAKVIVARNIFGPANNAPTMRLSTVKKYYNDEPVSYLITARDDDGHDLEYEIVDAGEIEDATLENKNNKATFKCGELKNGEYTVVFRATDNGLPAKSVEKEWKFVVRDRPDPPKKTTTTKTVKKVKHASETKVTFITSTNGNYKAKIKDYLTGEVFDLDLEDKTQFELDEKIWKVKDIRYRLVTLELDGKLLEFKTGSFLDQPVRETAATTESENDSPEITDVSTSTGK